jgi:hypothetical protein
MHHFPLLDSARTKLTCYSGPVRASPLTVMMVLEMGPRRHIPCLDIQVASGVPFREGSCQSQEVYDVVSRSKPRSRKDFFHS